MDSVIFLGIFGLILALTLLLIGKPLILESRNSRFIYEEDRTAISKDMLLTTINEIEFDFQMGKLAEEDYQFLENKYKSLAIKMLKEDDDRELTQNSEALVRGIEEEIEAELKEELKAAESPIRKMVRI